MKFWCDPAVEKLAATSKYLFLYLMTNEHRNESGLYSLSLAKILFETGLTKTQIAEGLDNLASTNQAKYDWDNEVVWVVNIVKYAALNDNCILSIISDLEHCASEKLRADFCDYYKEHLRLKELIQPMAIPLQGVSHGSPMGPLYILKANIQRSKTKAVAKHIIDEALFEDLWSKYPSKDGKKEAHRHFAASVITEQDKADIRVALQNYLKSEKVKNGYIKNGSTWFNNWKDWVTPAPAQMDPKPRVSQPGPTVAQPKTRRCEKCGKIYTGDVLCPNCFPRTATRPPAPPDPDGGTGYVDVSGLIEGLTSAFTLPPKGGTK